MGVEKTITLPNKVFYTEAFVNAVHANKQLLLDSPRTRITTVSGHEAIKFHGDLFGYLAAQNVPAHYYMAIIIINGYNSQLDFTEDTRSIYIPDSADLHTLVEQINLSGL